MLGSELCKIYFVVECQCEDGDSEEAGEFQEAVQ
jgi:hypothetical protein